MDLDFTYRGVNDTRLKMVQMDTHPAIVLGGNNPKLMAQINNYAPMRYASFTRALCFPFWLVAPPSVLTAVTQSAEQVSHIFLTMVTWMMRSLR